MRASALHWVVLISYGLFCHGLRTRTCLSAEEQANLDAASKAYLSPVVFQGKVVAVEKKTTTVEATFRVQKILKMSEMVLTEKSAVMVEFVYDSSRPARPGRRTPGLGNTTCMSSVRDWDLRPDQRYIVFVARRSPKQPSTATFIGVAIPEVHTRRSSRAVRKILCRRCAKPPSVRGLSDVNLEVQKVLRLRCKISGNPTPRIEWFRNDVRVRPNDRIQIKNKRRHSRLVIKRVTFQDSGQYECRATNVVGEHPASATAKVSVTTKQSNNDSTLWPLKGQPCPPDPQYCLNGGTCTLYETVKEYVCQCAEGYRGQRCESKAVSTLVVPRVPFDMDATTRMLQLYWGK